LAQVLPKRCLLPGRTAVSAHLITLTGLDIEQACELSGLSRSRLHILLKKHQIITLSLDSPAEQDSCLAGILLGRQDISCVTGNVLPAGFLA